MADGSIRFSEIPEFPGVEKFLQLLACKSCCVCLQWGGHTARALVGSLRNTYGFGSVLAIHGFGSLCVYLCGNCRVCILWKLLGVSVCPAGSTLLFSLIDLFLQLVRYIVA